MQINYTFISWLIETLLIIKSQILQTKWHSYKFLAGLLESIRLLEPLGLLSELFYVVFHLLVLSELLTQVVHKLSQETFTSWWISHLMRQKEGKTFSWTDRRMRTVSMLFTYSCFICDIKVTQTADVCTNNEYVLLKVNSQCVPARLQLGSRVTCRRLLSMMRRPEAGSRGLRHVCQPAVMKSQGKYKTSTLPTLQWIKNEWQVVNGILTSQAPSIVSRDENGRRQEKTGGVFPLKRTQFPICFGLLREDLHRGFLAKNLQQIICNLSDSIHRWMTY